MGAGGIVLIVVVILAVIGIAWLLFWWLYDRASKEMSFVRTGLGGEKVVMNSGAFVLPVLHNTTPVNMKTMLLDIARGNEQALITRDRMRVNVTAEFFVRVRPDAEAIAAAAQSLGSKNPRHGATAAAARREVRGRASRGGGRAGYAAAARAAHRLRPVGSGRVG